jgi:outer membrane protein assembly complex protein YaeT
MSDSQRLQAAKTSISGYLSSKGYLEANVNGRVVQIATGHKRVDFDCAPGVRYRGVKTMIQGASPQRSQELVSQLRERGLREAIYTDTGRVTETITRYYHDRGYLAVRVAPPAYELDAPRRTGRVIISLREGPVYRIGELRFSGNTSLGDVELSSALPIQAGAIAEPARLEPSAAAIRQKYGRMGFQDVGLEYDVARNDERATIDVLYNITENRRTLIGAVKVEGNSQTSAEFARSQLLVAEDEPANTALIRESVQNLSRAGAYGSADIQLLAQDEHAAAPSSDAVADLVVSVTEPKPFRVQYGGLYDSDNGPGFIVDVENRNSLGAGRVIGLRTRYDSGKKEARLYLNRPVWGLSRVSTTLSAYATQERVPDQVVPTETFGVSLQQDWQLRAKLLLSYGYRYEIQQDFLPEPGAEAPPKRRVATTPLSLSLSRDSRDAFLDATRGSFMSHGVEYAPRVLGSDYPYIRYYFQYFKYFPLTHPGPVPYGQPARRSRLVFASGSRLGVQTGFNPEGIVLTDRFFAGGGTTVRGFKQDSLGPSLPDGLHTGGNAVVVLNEELRFPLYRFLDGVAFVDAGNVFPRAGDISLSDLRSAGGFGLRVRNPFVVLRFDYGFKMDRRPGEKIGAFFFSVGQAF